MAATTEDKEDASAAAAASLAEEVQQLKALLRACGIPIQGEGARFAYVAPHWNPAGLSHPWDVRVVAAPTALPATDIAPDNYLQAIDSHGKIVDISIEEIEKRLTQVIQSIGQVARG